MSLDLDSLISEASNLVSEASGLDALESVRVELLGKKGRLTGVLKSIGQLPPEEKPAAGQAVNQAKQVVQAMIDTRGGVIRSLKLKKYPTSLEQPDDWLELVHSDSDSIYIVQSGLRNKQEKAPTHYSIYRTDKTAYELADGQDELVVPMYWTQDGIKVVKSYHFRRGDYLVDVKHQIENGSAQEWQGSEGSVEAETP